MINKVNLHQTPLPRSLSEAEQTLVTEVTKLYQTDSNQAIKFGNRKLSEDIWQPTFRNLVHKDHMENWQNSLNPFQKVANALFGEKAPKFLLPPKPKHLDVIAAERKAYFEGERGFAQRDV